MAHSHSSLLRLARVWTVSSALILAGCSFHPVVPNAKLGCTADSDCPRGLTCLPLPNSVPAINVCCSGTACDAPDASASKPDAGLAPDVSVEVVRELDADVPAQDRPSPSERAADLDASSPSDKRAADALMKTSDAALPPSPDAAGPDPAPPLGPLAGMYQLVARHSGKCLDDSESSTLAQFPCFSDLAGQMFNLQLVSGDAYRLINVQNKECVESSSTGTVGTAVVGHACSAIASEVFRLVLGPSGYYAMMQATTQLCAQVKDASPGDGVTIEQGVCASAGNQQWKITRRFFDDRHYSLTAKHSGKCVVVGPPVAPPGQIDPLKLAPLVQGACGLSDQSSQFSLQDRTGGVFSLVTATGGCCDIAASSFAAGAEARQWMCNGTNAQLFRIESVSGGFDRVVNVNSNQCLEVAGASADDGAKIVQSHCTGKDNQLFQVSEI